MEVPDRFLPTIILMRQNLIPLLVIFALLGYREARGSTLVPGGGPPPQEIRDTTPPLTSPDSALADTLLVSGIDSLPMDVEEDLQAILPGEEGARFPRPEHIRGVYMTAWTAGSSTGRRRLIDLIRRTELNSVVIDIKDATGYVSFASEIPLAQEVGATGDIRIRDLPGLLNELEEAGVYPIARIVVAKDPILAAGRPDLAIQDSAGGPWLDEKDVTWVNFHHPDVWEYHLKLALEVARAGFPEIQWDYVRFPDAAVRSKASAI
jgi:hypothetical protein